MGLREEIQEKNQTKVPRVIDLVERMGMEIYYALNAQLVLFQMTDEELDTIDKFLKACEEARN